VDVKGFEEKLLQHMDEFKCPVHLCLGQEDVPEALSQFLRKDDWLFSTHRSHGHYLAKGGDPQKLWDEIAGLETGINGGFSGSMSYSDPSINFHASAIVGGLIGVATGTALALKGSGSIVVCCVGDGATEEGVFWESINFSVVKKLPILFICENNQYSTHVHIKERQATPIWKRVHSFGMNARTHLNFDVELPCFVEVEVERKCAHANNMADFRELRAVNQ
jgi:TPP-dependent pyruvate/acetoin dehydrogenase alpha subunit